MTTPRTKSPRSLKPRTTVISRNQDVKSAATTIQRFQSEFGLTQPTVVRLSGYSARSVASWSKGVKATEPARRKFTELVRLLEALSSLVAYPEEITEWLQSPNPAFEGSTPLQVIERGETDRLWRMIYTLESGDPG